MTNRLTVSDGELYDILHCLRATAEANKTLAAENSDLRISRALSEQAERFERLADKVEDDE